MVGRISPAWSQASFGRIVGNQIVENQEDLRDASPHKGRLGREIRCLCHIRCMSLGIFSTYRFQLRRGCDRSQTFRSGGRSLPGCLPVSIFLLQSCPASDCTTSVKAAGNLPSLREGDRYVFGPCLIARRTTFPAVFPFFVGFLTQVYENSGL
jgi:hypothetical protein